MLSMRGFTLFVGFALCWQGQAWAERRIAPFDDKVILRVGNMWSNHDTSLQLSGDRGLGIGVDLEDTFNLDEQISNVFQFSVLGRFKQRHRVGLQYYSFNRDSESKLQTDWQGDDISVEAGAQVESELNIRITDISYQYSFVRDDKHELAGSFGLFWMDLDIDLRFSGQIMRENEENSEFLEGSEGVSAGLSAPLPVLGLNYTYAATSRWLTSVSFQYFSLRTNLVSGALVKVSVDTRYYFWDRFEVGGGLTMFDLAATVDSGDLKGRVDWSFWGPQLFLGWRF